MSPSMERSGSGRTVPTLLLAAWLLLLSGCALVPGREPRGWSVGEGSNEIVVEIQNDHTNDARIYLRWNGERRRLGFVTAKTSQTFRTEWRSSDLRIEVDFLAGSGYVTQPTPVSPGDRLHYRIPIAR